MRREAAVLSLTALLSLGIGYSQTSAPPSPQLESRPVQQESSAQPDTVEERHAKTHGHSKSAGAEVGSGAGDIGKGAAKGAGDLAKGTGKGAVDLATLHPLNAATDIGTGAVKAGGHVAVGTAKGTGKVAKGTGKALKKVF